MKYLILGSVLFCGVALADTHITVYESPQIIPRVQTTISTVPRFVTEAQQRKLEQVQSDKFYDYNRDVYVSRPQAANRYQYDPRPAYIQECMRWGMDRNRCENIWDGKSE